MDGREMAELSHEALWLRGFEKVKTVKLLVTYRAQGSKLSETKLIPERTKVTLVKTSKNSPLPSLAPCRPSPPLPHPAPVRRSGPSDGEPSSSWAVQPRGESGLKVSPSQFCAPFPRITFLLGDYQFEALVLWQIHVWLESLQQDLVYLGTAI